jgi:hypothetical protein
MDNQAVEESSAIHDDDSPSSLVRFRESQTGVIPATCECSPESDEPDEATWHLAEPGQGETVFASMGTGPLLETPDISASSRSLFGRNVACKP